MELSDHFWNINETDMYNSKFEIKIDGNGERFTEIKVDTDFKSLNETETAIYLKIKKLITYRSIMNYYQRNEQMKIYIRDEYKHTNSINIHKGMFFQNFNKSDILSSLHSGYYGLAVYAIETGIINIYEFLDYTVPSYYYGYSYKSAYNEIMHDYIVGKIGNWKSEIRFVCDIKMTKYKLPTIDITETSSFVRKPEQTNKVNQLIKYKNRFRNFFASSIILSSVLFGYLCYYVTKKYY